MDNIEHLKLHFSQLSKAWEKSQFNIYSDKSKKDYSNNLSTLFEYLTNCNFELFNSNEIIEHRFIISFIYKSLEYLNSSTLNQIPYEIVECLNKVLNEWIKEDYIITTSLVNEMNSFSILNDLAFYDSYYIIIKAKCDSIDFNKKLIQINLPKSLSRDYFSNVALYHELGHFIEEKYNISETFYRIFYPKISTHYSKYFYPGFTPVSIKYKEIAMSQLSEYFADIFAAQYVGESLNYFLKSITPDPTSVTETHPSANNRIQIVQDFVNGTKNELIDDFISITKSITKLDLNKRYKMPSPEDVFNLVPTIISNEEELHGLFPLAWKIWMNDKAKFKAQNNIQFELSDGKTYQIINNLIEKSISNYFIKVNWDKA